MKNVFFCVLCLVSISSIAQEKILPPASVTFKTSNTATQILYDRAEALAIGNIVTYGDRKVMIEGAQYKSIWLETQPMAGYMYAKRNLEIAKNNFEIFMDYQREDGRLPGVIYNREGVINPNYAQFQGLYFAMPAYELYFLLGKDKTYLNRVYSTLKNFDAYLWKTRDSDNNGCLETWCIYDTGEDHSVRFNEFPNAWSFDYPPSKKAASRLSPEELKINCKQEHYNPAIEMTVPIESMDIMSYSYSCRYVLALISKVLKNGEEAFWSEQASVVSAKIKSYLWDNTKKACYDKDRDNNTMPVLLHNNLRCMYFGSFDQQMADDFIQYHLVNPEEFWTPMPLPSIAANDPFFRNIAGNNWSGQPQGLTYQRSIRALENYGHYAELTTLGLKFLAVLDDSLKFTQQFDPFTATINNSGDGYGPTLLAALEFISRLYGVHITQEKVYWSSVSNDQEYSYTQQWNGRTFALQASGKQVKCFINEKQVFTFTKGVRIVTDLSGNLIEVIGIEEEPGTITIKYKKEYAMTVEPNAVYRVDENGKMAKVKSIPFFKPGAH